MMTEITNFTNFVTDIINSFSYKVKDEIRIGNLDTDRSSLIGLILIINLLTYYFL